MDLDVKQEAPVGKGKIICASFFAGPSLNFGRGPRVFIDNFGKNAGLINYFKPYLESEKYLKIWHNYGFDRHLFYNHGIDVKGFGGDTMHMARLLDPSKIPGQYALSALTKEHKTYITKLSTQKIMFIKSEIIKELTTEQDPERQK
jgi:DNA polymerase-1